MKNKSPNNQNTTKLKTLTFKQDRNQNKEQPKKQSLNTIQLQNCLDTSLSLSYRNKSGLHSEKSSKPLLKANKENPVKSCMKNSLKQTCNNSFHEIIQDNSKLKTKESQNDQILQFRQLDTNSQQDHQKTQNKFITSEQSNMSKNSFKSKIECVSDSLCQKFPYILYVYNQYESWITPKRLTIEQLQYKIEEIYSKKFKEANQQLNNKNQKITELSQIALSFWNEKGKDEQKNKQNLLNIAYSLDFYSQKHLEVQLFIKFLSEEYQEEELMFYLYVRNICEKELQIQMINYITKQAVCLKDTIITQKQIRQILEITYDQNQLAVHRLISEIQPLMDSTKQNKSISLSVFLYMLMVSFHQHLNNDKKQMEIKYEITIDPMKNLLDLINEQLKNKVYLFIINLQQEIPINLDKALSFIFPLLDQLLSIILKLDKVEWFKKLMINNPTKEQLASIESIHKEYRSISKLHQNNSLDDQQLDQLCSLIARCPEVVGEIGKTLYNLNNN